MMRSSANTSRSERYAFVQGLTFKQALNFYRYLHQSAEIGDEERRLAMAVLGMEDRFYLLTHTLNRHDAIHPWLYERSREVEAESDGCLDLWARGHYKSTIITFAGSIQEIIRDPEITIGIFSHTRPIAKAFLDQIKQECEQNPKLPWLYPEVFWSDPRKEAPSWSLERGLVMRRRSNPKEKTVEAWGLVDGQPVSKHFGLLIYNDVVVEGSVSTPEMILKTTKAWELSRNLTCTESAGALSSRSWHEGTRYNFADTYGVILGRKVLKPRVHPATDNGLPDGQPVFLTADAWARKKAESSASTIACQQLQNPIAGSEQEFKPEWLRRWEVRPETLNVAILVDPANSKKRSSCNTAMAVIGIDAHFNKYLLDGACHKMSLTERWEMLKYLRFKWLNQKGIQIVRVGYEKYGMQADIEHFQEMMKIEKCAFPIDEVSWARETNEQAKDDRIRRLIPDHQNWRFFYPYEGTETGQMRRADELGKGFLKAAPIKRKDHEGQRYNLVEWVVANEYLFFPATTAKDFMDAMSRIYDLSMNPPQVVREDDVLPEYVGDF